jgi:hypothetical protein
MRLPFAILCLALALAGCRGSGTGMLGRMTIPPPGTQPPGALLADNSYSPRPEPAAVTSSATIPVPPSVLPATQPAFTAVADRRGAAIARSTLGAPSRAAPPAATASREESIRIPDNSAAVGTLASIVRIQGIPTTDATGFFQTAGKQLPQPANVATRTTRSSGFVEISQLPNASAASRRAALPTQPLR